MFLLLHPVTMLTSCRKLLRHVPPMPFESVEYTALFFDPLFKPLLKPVFLKGKQIMKNDEKSA